MKPGDRVTLIKQLADKMKDDSYTDIDLTLSAFGFPTSYNWDGDQYSYLVTYLGRGEDEWLLDLHKHLFGFSGEASTSVTPAFWADGYLRLFLSHVSAEKVFTSELKTALAEYGISGFVAHEDIEPTKEWVDEIETGLSTCDALAAVLTPTFPDSKWTDQEVGYVHGRRALIVPIRRGLDPYGFIARYQGVNGNGRTAGVIASELYRILVKHEKTSAKMAEALVTRFEHSGSFNDAKANVSRLGDIVAWTPELLRRIEEAAENNGQNADAWGVPDQVERILRDHGATPKPKAVASPFDDDDDDDLPF